MYIYVLLYVTRQWRRDSEEVIILRLLNFCTHPFGITSIMYTQTVRTVHITPYKPTYMTEAVNEEEKEAEDTRQETSCMRETLNL